MERISIDYRDIRSGEKEAGSLVDLPERSDKLPVLAWFPLVPDQPPTLTLSSVLNTQRGARAGKHQGILGNAYTGSWGSPKLLTCTQQTANKQDTAFSRSCLKIKLLVSFHCNLHLV